MDCLPQIHTIAIHAEAGYNSVVPGIGILCRENGYVGGIGAYHNSVKRSTQYAYLGWQPFSYKNFKMGVFGGVATGYKKQTIPFAGFMITQKVDWNIGIKEIHYSILPPYKDENPLTIGISISF